LNKWSDDQDRGEVAVAPEDTVRFRKVSAPGLVAYVLTITFASVDWVMSLDPTWYSTIFGLITVAGQGLSGLALVMLWAYFAFSQFLIIWAGNLPEEIPFFVNRMSHGWQFVSLAIVLGHFALPFVLLLSRDLKRRPRLLAKVAAAILVMRLVDSLWLVAPMFPQGAFPIHWMDLVVPMGPIGVWLFLFARRLRSRALLPLNDPFFKEAFAHDVR
jgi:hypothetical protein